MLRPALCSVDGLRLAVRSLCGGVAQSVKAPGLSRRRPRVRVPSLPPFSTRKLQYGSTAYGLNWLTFGCPNYPAWIGDPEAGAARIGAPLPGRCQVLHFNYCSIAFGCRLSQLVTIAGLVLKNLAGISAGANKGTANMDTIANQFWGVFLFLIEPWRIVECSARVGRFLSGDEATA